MADQQHLSRLVEGLAGFNRWRLDNPDQLPDLGGAELNKANLRRANLRGANLRGANLSGADLTGARLGGANLSRTNLGATNLEGAYLRRADLTKADLTGTYLGGADLDAAKIAGANLAEAHLEGAHLGTPRWDPDVPPTWPVGFDPPENAWAEEERHTTAAQDLEVTRTTSVTPESLQNLTINLEPFLSVVERLLESTCLSDFDAARAEHARRALRQEMWENPDEPSSLVISAHMAKLFEVAAPYLPATTTDARTEPNQTDEHAHQALRHAANLGAEDPETAAAEAAAVADQLSDVIAETGASSDEEPTSEALSAADSSSLLTKIGWVVDAGTKVGGGAVGVAGLFSQIFHLLSPTWAAVLGAATGMLAHLFHVGHKD